MPKLLVKVKRIYEEPQAGDGLRVLVDRLWPRGLSKDRAAADHWLKDLAPSDQLRRWFGHKPERWEEFKARYFQELQHSALLSELQELARLCREQPITLLYGARDPHHNNAVALKELLESLVVPR